MAGVAVATALALIGRHRQAILLATASVLLTLGSLATPVSGGELSRSLALATTPLVIPITAAAFAERRPAAAWLAVLGGVLVGPIRALVYDPIRDIGCAACFPSGIVLYPNLNLAHALALSGGLIVFVGLSLGVPVARRPVPAALLAVSAGLAVMGYRVPTGVRDVAVLTGAWVGVVAGLVVAASAWVARRRLAALAAGMRSAAGPEAALREVLRDPDLSIAFPIGAGFIDVDGRPARDPAPGQRMTPLSAGGDTLAVLRHAVGLDIVGQLRLNDDLLLGITAARLTALLRAQVAELALSRARVVARADEEARRLERDLHDGAQQHLLAFGVELRWSLAATTDGLLAASLAEVRTCLDALRGISHGIYPPVLAAAGLVPALSTLLGEENVREFHLPPGRLPDVAERTAYLVVLEIASLAAEPITVTGRHRDGIIEVEVTGPAPPRDSLLHDRVAAAGGNLVARPDGVVVVTIPCV